jgi:PTS system cellobiose-specific IIC component
MNKLISLGQKMSTNRYLSAIRDGFIIALPLTLAASFAILINNVVLATNLPYGLANPDYYNAQFIAGVQVVKFVFSSVEFGALQWLSPLVLMGIAYSLSMQSKAEKPFVNTLIIFAVFIVLLPKDSLAAGGYWQNASVPGYEAAIAQGLATVSLANLFSSANLFTALIVGIVFTELLLKLQGVKRLEIVLPDQVPPMVAKSFSTLIPAFLVLLLAGILAAFFMYVKPLGFGDMSSFISGLVQRPFLALAHSGIGGLTMLVVYVFFANFLWIFGLHGPNILAGFSGPTLTALTYSNQTMFAETADAFAPELASYTMGFVDAYTQYGGSGATLGLLIAIYLVSKRADYRAIGKLASAPGLFEINEPLSFGLPIVLNPILGIPFVLAPLVSIILPAILTWMGWLPKVVVAIPWVTPPILNAFLATGANWRGAFVGIVNVVLITLVYLPFVVASNKVQASEHSGVSETAKEEIASTTKEEKEVIKMEQVDSGTTEIAGLVKAKGPKQKKAAKVKKAPTAKKAITKQAEATAMANKAKTKKEITKKETKVATKTNKATTPKKKATGTKKATVTKEAPTKKQTSVTKDKATMKEKTPTSPRSMKAASKRAAATDKKQDSKPKTSAKAKTKKATDK